MAGVLADAAADWCENEFSSIELGDERLNKRIVKFSQTMLSKPESSINEAHTGWTETKAAYRMLDNEKLTPEGILEAHHDSLAERVKGKNLIFAIQDTTYFRFDALVDLRKEKPRKRFRDMHGIVMHHCLAVSATGLPLGEISQKLYDRDIGSYYGGHYDHQKIPIEKKESFRWIDALRQTSNFGDDHDVKFVTLADRECDIYEFLQEANELGEDFVIRAAKDRRTLEHSYTKAPEKKIWHMTENSPSMGSYRINPKTNSQLREAEVSVRCCNLTLKPAKRLIQARSEELKPITVSCILAREESPPSGEDAIEWMLLTNLEINSFQEACEKISWYEKRWTIEAFHKVMKSGFKAERWQPKSPERLYRFIAIISILAVRLYEMSHRVRENPDECCSVILKEHEWKALQMKAKGRVIDSQTPPNLSEAITWIAILGGYLNRTSDPPPGSMVIWRGWKRLQDLSDAWLLFQG